MSIYYVRQSGSDAAAGTSAGAAWATLGKALGASGIASGDTVYVGAGVYREAVTVNMTSATAETKVIGDTDGVKTGDPGIVRWTGITDDRSYTTVTPITINARDFLTFENIYFDAATIVVSSGVGSTNVVFRNCTMFAHGSSVALSLAFDAVCNWTLDSCTIMSYRNNGMTITLATHASADYDANFSITNCVIMCLASSPVSVTASGALSFKGGGVKARNCHLSGATCFSVSSANINTSTPCLVYNCIIQSSGTAISATTLGQILEDANVLSANSARSNVNTGPLTRYNSAFPVFELGQSERAGLARRRFFTPADGSPLLGFGNISGSPSTDGAGLPRPSGPTSFKASGTATSGAAGTLTNTGAEWRTNAFTGMTVRITGGTGSGQTKLIVSNTTTVLTVSGSWATTPDNTSTYEVYEGCPSTTGKATSGGAATLTDTGATHGITRWMGYVCEITAGTGSGQTRQILSHTTTVLTLISNWTTNPDNTSVYAIYVATGLTTLQPACGPMERGNTATRETVTIDSGYSPVSAYGPWTHDFVVAVDEFQTTLAIKSNFDSQYGGGTKPQMKVINGTECGVADATSTSTETAGNWYSHSLAFTPTAQGIVTVRLISYGLVDAKCVFDTFSQTH